MIYYKEKNEEAEKINSEMKEILDKEIFDEKYIRKLIGKQKGELSAISNYYNGNIAEGNWSLIGKDENIIELDKKKYDDSKIIDVLDVILGLAELPDKDEIKDYRKNDAEYEYVFKPSYYAINILIEYYLKNSIQAKRIYNLRNAVVRRIDGEYYGGLPFVLKYIKFFLKHRDDERFTSILENLKKLIREIYNRNYGLEINNAFDDFINDIIDCIMDSCGEELILEIRTEDFDKGKKDFLTEYKVIDNYKILIHRDVKKDFKHLNKNEIKKANEKIEKTPYHPYNNAPSDSWQLEQYLKGWFGQKVSDKGNKMVYKKIEKDKVVYIAAICGHYEDAPGRVKKLDAYK